MLKSNIQWNAKQVSKMFDNDCLHFDNVIQRGNVWDKKRQSLLVDSMLRGYPIPPMYTIKTEEKVKTPKGMVSVFDCIDGKQRCTAINEFKNNRLSLTGLEAYTDGSGNEIDLNGLTYDELDEDMKDTFDSYSLTVYFFSDITDDEISEMMSRLNNGKPLTGIEAARIKARNLPAIASLAKHPFFTRNLSETAIKLCDDVFNFKIGAKVVMLVNDSNGFYQNGTVGTITKISYRNDEDDDLWGIEGTEIDTISVTFSKNNTVEVKRQTFSKKEYVAEIKDVPKLDENGKPIVENGVPVMTSVKELKQKEIGSAEQFPMRLGYAVTIHKSQGQTYDSMNLAPEIFATGQLYVALSRCKSIQNIYVSGFLSKRMVMASNEVVEFYNNPNGHTFFNKEEEMKAVFIPKKYVSRVEKLIAEWSGAI